MSSTAAPASPAAPAVALGPLAGPAPGTWRRLLPGLALSAALAAASMALGRIGWLQDHGFSALTVAIALGTLMGNTLYPRFAAAAGAGVHFARLRLLRLGIVLYGLRLTVQDIGHVGAAGVLIDALVLGTTFALACWLGTRWLGLDRRTAMLIGAGSSICGAAAVLATEPVVKARAEQVTVAVATVVVCGTLAVFLYPLLSALNRHWPFIPGAARGFGIYVGSTVHEVAQVVAAAHAVGGGAPDAAVIAKMVRVMMLAPFLVMLAAWLGRGRARGAAPGHGQADGPGSLAVPWFAFGFVGVVLFNSLHWLPAGAVAVVNEIDTALLVMAMAALGLSTHLGALRQAGAGPVLLALALFAWLVGGGALINLGVMALLG
jgi:uncharacterized integral membrane protein (TIGR00698 family)